MGLGAAAGGTIGFVSGFVGAALGHWWDYMRRKPDSFGSGALFTLVVSGTLDIFLILLAASRRPSAYIEPRVLTILIGFAGIASSASKSLLDDLQAAYSAPKDDQTNDAGQNLTGGETSTV